MENNVCTMQENIIQENPMLYNINHTYLSSLKDGYHFGSSSNFNRFQNSYFEEIHDNIKNTTIINKAIIMSIVYEPDETYSIFDGYFGTCWKASIVDSSQDNSILYIHFRNFGDLVSHYEKKGFRFIDVSNK